MVSYCALSSVVEHRLDVTRAESSILSARTTLSKEQHKSQRLAPTAVDAADLSSGLLSRLLERRDYSPLVGGSVIIVRDVPHF